MSRELTDFSDLIDEQFEIEEDIDTTDMVKYLLSLFV